MRIFISFILFLFLKVTLRHQEPARRVRYRIRPAASVSRFSFGFVSGFSAGERLPRPSVRPSRKSPEDFWSEL